MRDLLMGIDGGTGGARAYIFDRTGKVLGTGSCPYDTVYPQSGWAEQKAEDWWNAVCVSVREALAGAGVPAGRIAAVAAATTSCTVLACSAQGEALLPALLWMDVRASGEAKEIEKSTGQQLSAELFPCKLLWMKHHQPESYARADYLCEYQDYLNYQLTNEWCFSVNTACNWGYNRRKGGFDEEFYRSAGLADALEKIPGRAVAAGEKIGRLTLRAAKALGLDAETVVVQGGIDASIGMLGMGVAEPGAVALMTGSSNLAMAVTVEPCFGNPDAVNLGPDFLLEGYYTSVRGQVSAGSILRWFRREFCRDLGEDALAQLDVQAREVPCGSNGLMILDYWQGNRVPHEDADIRGMIYGLSMNTTREMLFRAVMESVAYGTEDILEAFREKGYPVEWVCISGGTTRSDVFLQIHADVSGIPFAVASDYSVALGCAVCAGRAMGMYGSLQEAAAHMVQMQKMVFPDREKHRIYQGLQRKYRGLYPAVRKWLDE